MASIGVGTLRQPFLWREIEYVKGTLDFSRYDELVGQISSLRIKILGVVFGPPPFRMKAGPSKYTCPPNSNEEFGDYAAALAKRYGSKGTYWAEHPSIPRNPITTWQIWNEPNIRPYWCGKPNARQYVAMLRAANRALKKADPRTETITAGHPEEQARHPDPHLPAPALQRRGQDRRSTPSPSTRTAARFRSSGTCCGRCAGS